MRREVPNCSRSIAARPYIHGLLGRISGGRQLERIAISGSGHRVGLDQAGSFTDRLRRACRLFQARDCGHYRGEPGQCFRIP